MIWDVYIERGDARGESTIKRVRAWFKMLFYFFIMVRVYLGGVSSFSRRRPRLPRPRPGGRFCIKRDRSHKPTSDAFLLQMEALDGYVLLSRTFTIFFGKCEYEI